MRRFTGSLATFSYLKDVFQNVADGFSQLSGAGIKLDSQMHDLSAVAGVTGEGLKQIETFARQSAKFRYENVASDPVNLRTPLSAPSTEAVKFPAAALMREKLKPGECPVFAGFENSPIQGVSSPAQISEEGAVAYYFKPCAPLQVFY